MVANVLLQATSPLAERWYHSGECHVLLSVFFHSCLVRELCVLSFSHDTWWGKEIQRDFPTLPNFMQFCEGYFLPPISCSLLITRNVDTFLSLGRPTSWQTHSAPKEVGTLKEGKNIKREDFISPQLAPHQKGQQHRLLCSFAPTYIFSCLIWDQWGSSCKQDPASTTPACHQLGTCLKGEFSWCRPGRKKQSGEL